MHTALIMLIPLMASEAIPVVDIDYTVFIQGGLFLALVFILKPLLFEPWLAARDRRAQRIGGALEEANLMNARAAEKLAQYDARLRRAKDDAIEARADRRKAAEAEEATVVADARREASEAFERHKALIEADIVKARIELQGRVTALAADVTKQVLGRSA